MGTVNDGYEQQASPSPPDVQALRKVIRPRLARPDLLLFGDMPQSRPAPCEDGTL
jgi:hypothetical protein